MHFYQTREYKAELTTHSLYFLLFLQFSPSLSWSLFFISIFFLTFLFSHTPFPTLFSVAQLFVLLWVTIWHLEFETMRERRGASQRYWYWALILLSYSTKYQQWPISRNTVNVRRNIPVCFKHHQSVFGYLQPPIWACSGRWWRTGKPGMPPVHGVTTDQRNNNKPSPLEKKWIW